MGNNQEIKAEIRKTILAKRNSLDSKLCIASGEALLEKLIAGEYLKGIDTVFIYVSTGSEVSTFQSIEFMLNNSIRVCVPKITGKGEMQAVEIKSLNDLVPGKFGIYEPVGDDVIDLAAKDVALVPGVAFDKEGCRIGYGGGYYDRYFSKFQNLKGVYKLGICYDFQLVDRLPYDKHDVKMNEVLQLTF